MRAAAALFDNKEDQEDGGHRIAATPARFRQSVKYSYMMKSIS